MCWPFPTVTEDWAPHRTWPVAGCDTEGGEHAHLPIHQTDEDATRAAA